MTLSQKLVEHTWLKECLVWWVWEKIGRFDKIRRIKF